MSNANKLLVVAILQFGVIVFLLLRPAVTGATQPQVSQARMPPKSMRPAEVLGEPISEAEAERLADEVREKNMLAYRAQQARRAQRDRYLGRSRDPEAARFDLLWAEAGPTEALKAVGLSDNDRPALEKSIRNLRDKMDTAFAARAVLDEEAAAKGKVVYRVPADDAAGTAAISQFRDELTAQFGKEAAEKLLKGFHPTRYFGGFGRMDLRMELSEGPAATGGITAKIIYQNSDPETGEEFRGGSGPAESFAFANGKAIVDKMLAKKAELSGSR
ncbi:hypothetical protein [Haloferula sp. BvORR071]|uniref:hypothetical protein n=1 Tax=Haloferula sp. BvORR071 TaxID=1396141 RepID=UPI000558AFCB|nr:hypothetical protein [Haloferula sp. BvORR071]